ncbi:hypothetical protein KDA00_03420 [Candidatus Saccharibacteria bacterium]|nr:hypothetical protein [Candidatus Saccharibacteria bacterium]
MEEQRVYKDFDLPTKHLGGNTHFVPPKARDEGEIERRRSLVRGVLLAEHQERGLAIASTILKHVKDDTSVRFASRIIAAGGLNTAWYGFARGAESEVMRRRLKLPFLAVHKPELRESSDDMLYDAAFQFSEARAQADLVKIAIESCSPKTDRLKRVLGRTVGKASLTLACTELGDELIMHPLSSVDTQLRVRQRSLGALNDARTLQDEMGLPPSIAQFADRDSHLSVFWRREAPTEAVRAYETAVDLQLAA